MDFSCFIDLKRFVGFLSRIVNNFLSLLTDSSNSVERVNSLSFSFSETASALAASITLKSVVADFTRSRAFLAAKSALFCAALMLGLSFFLAMVGLPSSIYSFEAFAAEERRSLVWER